MSQDDGHTLSDKVRFEFYAEINACPMLQTSRAHDEHRTGKHCFCPFNSSIECVEHFVDDWSNAQRTLRGAREVLHVETT